MYKMIVRVFCLILTAAFVFLSASSCAEKMSDEEISKEARELIEKSYEVNEIFFGKGLPLDESRIDYSAIAKLEYEDNDVLDVYYIPVSDECEYEYTETLKEAAKAVYTTEYCEKSIFPVVFEGITNADGEVIQYARFIVNEYGEMTQRYDADGGISLPNRTYDFESVKSVKQSSRYVIFTIDSYIDGEKSDIVEITMKKEDSGWRLDTPTY